MCASQTDHESFQSSIRFGFCCLREKKEWAAMMSMSVVIQIELEKARQMVANFH